MKREDWAQLEQIRDVICSVADVEKIYLFGSFAYGNARQDSDFDIYVLLADDSERPLKAVQRINMALSRLDIRSVDILADKAFKFYERSAGPTLERTIADKGVQLYERDVLDSLAGSIPDNGMTLEEFRAERLKKYEI